MSEALNLPLLAGQRVLICRPEPAASALQNALEAVGAQCQRLPCLEIKALELDGAARDKILNLDRYAQVIALSQHAATLAGELVDQYWPQQPIAQQWHAIGRKTAQALQAEGIELKTSDSDMTSEQLLEHPDLQDLSGQKILLLKGENGRKKLAQVLAQRGAEVDSLELYKRLRPDYDKAILTQVFEDFKPQFIITLSGETLENLHHFAKQINARLGQTRFIVSSNRVAKLAASLGYPLSYSPSNLMPMDIITTIIAARRGD